MLNACLNMALEYDLCQYLWFSYLLSASWQNKTTRIELKKTPNPQIKQQTTPKREAIQEWWQYSVWFVWCLHFMPTQKWDYKLGGAFWKEGQQPSRKRCSRLGCVAKEENKDHRKEFMERQWDSWEEHRKDPQPGLRHDGKTQFPRDQKILQNQL